MEVVWDPLKRFANLQKHGLDFVDIKPNFFLTAAIEARPPREKAVGWLHDRPVALIYAPLGSEGVSLVSLRPANSSERRLLDDKS